MTDLPAGLGRFDHGGLSFAVDDGLTRVELEQASQLDEQSFDDRLDVSAPEVGSWILARLVRMGDGTMDLTEDTVEVVDGGVFVIDFVVRSAGPDGRAVGKVQLQAAPDGAGLLGLCESHIDVPKTLASALRANPKDLAVCRVRVRDPSWPQDRVVTYGFDGSQLHT